MKDRRERQAQARRFQPSKTMKNTIAGSSCILAASICVLAGGILGTSPKGYPADFYPVFLFVALIPFCLGLYFLFDRPSLSIPIHIPPQQDTGRQETSPHPAPLPEGEGTQNRHSREGGNPDIKL